MIERTHYLEDLVARTRTGMVKVVTGCIVLSLAFSTALAGVVITSPPDGATVPLLTEAQKAYLTLPRAERREKFADEDYRKNGMGLPAEQVEGEKKPRKAYWPKTVRLAWTGASSPCKVFVKNAKSGACAYEAEVAGNAATVDNLEIAAEYEWTVFCGDEKASSRFRTEDLAPRLIRFPGVANVRDLGGRIGLGGRRVRQGLVFRSAGLNGIAQATGPEKDKLVAGKSHVEGPSGEYIRGRFGIRSDVDLRSDRECYGMTGSPLGESVTWFHYPSSAYAGMQTDGGKKAFAKVFRVFLDRRNYPIDFHCIAGQDRTGAVAFILNALLGVDEDQLYRDWETTGFWNRVVGFRHEPLFDKLVEGFVKSYPAPTIRESVEKYVLALGFTTEDIDVFRDIMLERPAP